MSKILVTPLSAVPEVIRTHRPSHLVTLLSPEHMIETPAGFPAERHLRLGVNDVVDVEAGDHPPARQHIEALLAFTRAWPAEDPILVHCWAGISRSMASAYTILCDRLGPGSEIAAARAIRDRAAHAYPNALLVQHADDLLGRQGRMVDAIRSIGAGKMVAEGELVEFPPGGIVSAQTELVVSIGLSAAIVSVADERPCVLTVHHPGGGEDALPFGPFDPLNHRTLESGLRKWVGEQTLLDLGYAEQLYTFGDRGRHVPAQGEGARVVSVGYLALTRQAGALQAPDAAWSDWYRYFPWEDFRDARPAVIDRVIAPALRQFVKAAANSEIAELRRERARLCFGFEGLAWDEEKVLERYELLYEAGLVQEAVRDGRKPSLAKLPPTLGTGMTFDHRRILATAIARLRGKMKYRPVVFEVMPPAFTLLELQRTVEAISGIRLHKQNFRRLMEDQGLVEGTGKFSTQARGRPAELFRFRREVLRERPAPGVRMVTRARG